MAVGARELSASGVLVTRLSATEDAAAMDVLCVDKTGTITANHLAVARVVPLAKFSEEDVLRHAAYSIGGGEPGSDRSRDPRGGA